MTWASSSPSSSSALATLLFLLTHGRRREWEEHGFFCRDAAASISSAQRSLNEDDRKGRGELNWAGATKNQVPECCRLEHVGRDCLTVAVLLLAVSSPAAKWPIVFPSCSTCVRTFPDFHCWVACRLASGGGGPFAAPGIVAPLSSGGVGRLMNVNSRNTAAAAAAAAASPLLAPQRVPFAPSITLPAAGLGGRRRQPPRPPGVHTHSTQQGNREGGSRMGGEEEEKEETSHFRDRGETARASVFFLFPFRLGQMSWSLAPFNRKKEREREKHVALLDRLALVPASE